MKNKETEINTLKEWIKESKYTVLLTGAGMSTESGIPDFRSKDGLWKKVDPMKLASIQTLNNDYDTFYEFYKARSEKLSNIRPHKGYDILAKWERDGFIDSIITQNVDDFHLIAGNKNVYRLHGSLNEFRCSVCEKSGDKKDFIDKKPCKKCGENLRPNVVLFGEGLPEDDFSSAIEEVKKAELVIVIGTSLSVFPVSQLPDLTSGKKVYINKEIRDANGFELIIQGSAGELLDRIDRILYK